jgi:hypothetical protein
VPVTHRGDARAVTIVTGHEAVTSEPVAWEHLAQVGGTIVVMMGVERRAHIAGLLIDGGMAIVVLPKDRYAELIDRAVAVARGLGLQAWPREEAPAGLRTRNPRFGDVVVVAPVGTAIQSSRTPLMHGAHGYDPQEPAMGALLLAVGRGAPAGAQLGELRSLDVAPTVLRLLGLTVPDTMEGRPIAGLLPGTGADAKAPTGAGAQAPKESQ